MKLNARELGTVLAALRIAQANPEDFEGMTHFEDGTKPLTYEEIDELCLRININEDKIDKTVWVLGTETDDGNGFYAYATQELGEQAYISMVNQFYPATDRHGQPDATTYEEAQDKASEAVDHGSMDFIYLNECEIEGSQAKEYSEKEQIALGNTIAELFRLKRDREHNDRYAMGGGYMTKTALGVFRSFMNIADKIRDGKEIEA